MALRILFLPWFIWVGLMLTFAFISIQSQPSWFEEYIVYLLWFLVGIANNIFWGLRAKNDLKTNFRQVAAKAASA